MNIYKHKFYSSCPVNGQIIAYTLEIRTESRVMVEHIVTRCALNKSGYHETIADDLASAFPGKHILKAHHHGVDIETLRKGLKND